MSKAGTVITVLFPVSTAVMCHPEDTGKMWNTTGKLCYIDAEMS